MHVVFPFDHYSFAERRETGKAETALHDDLYRRCSEDPEGILRSTTRPRCTSSHIAPTCIRPLLCKEALLTVHIHAETEKFGGCPSTRSTQREGGFCLRQHAQVVFYFLALPSSCRKQASLKVDQPLRRMQSSHPCPTKRRGRTMNECV
jgi:hypothetical protein